MDLKGYLNPEEQAILELESPEVTEELAFHLLMDISHKLAATNEQIDYYRGGIARDRSDFRHLWHRSEQLMKLQGEMIRLAGVPESNLPK